MYSFEPVQDTINILKKSKELYNKSIEICPNALSNRVGSANFEISDNSNSENRMIEKSDNNLKVVVLSMTTIDKFV